MNSTKPTVIEMYKDLLYLAGSLLSKCWEQQKVLENTDETKTVQRCTNNLLEFIFKSIQNLSVLGSRFVDQITNVNVTSEAEDNFAEVFANIQKILEEAELQKTDRNVQSDAAAKKPTNHGKH